MNQFQVNDIIYEDREMLVCRKHMGMAVQSAKSGEMDMECALKNYLTLQEKKEQYQIPYLGIIHRLDQPVEGVLVFAKTSLAAKELNRQMAEGKMEKYYLAMVCTSCAPAEGILDDHLQKDGRTNTSKVVSKETKSSKRAVLEYRLLEQRENVAQLEIKLKTGRHHQIRVQMAHANMPLWGDRKYNSAEELTGQSAIGLCAYKLKLYHPKSRNEMNFEIEPENVIFGERINIK